MHKATGLYRPVHADAEGAGVVSHAGAVVLLDTVRVAGLDIAPSSGLSPWRAPTAVHDPGEAHPGSGGVAGVGR